MEYIRGGGSRRKRKGEGTTDAVVVASPSPCARGATARLPRPRKVSPVTFNFRAVGKSPPLELGHRPADSRPPPPSLPPRFYPTTATALLSRPHSSPLPRLNFRLSYLARISKRVHTRLFALFFLPPIPLLSFTIDERKERKIARKRSRAFSLTRVVARWTRRRRRTTSNFTFTRPRHRPSKLQIS